MKILIDGRELLVKKSAVVFAAWQQATGHPLTWLGEPENQAYQAPFSAWCALKNAGFTPDWEELINTDIDEFQVIEEPGDARSGGDAVVPPSSPADSEEEDDGVELHVVKDSSKRSSKQNPGSKSK